MDNLILVEVKKDHLDKISRASVLNAVTELIWNAFDADASLISVITSNDSLGLESMHVKDNGHGIAYKDAKSVFSGLGGSWKAIKNVSPKGRFLHGKEGQGRFKAFSIGRFVEWKTIFLDGEKTIQYSIKGTADNKAKFESSTPEICNSSELGTVVSIYEPHKEFNSINTEKLLEHFSGTFAVYLLQYPDIQLLVNEKRVDPKSQIKNDVTVSLESVVYGEKEHPYELQIIEWDCHAENKVYFCDAKGFPIISYEKPIRGVNDFSYTAYLKSSHIELLNKNGTLGLGDLEPSLTKPIDLAVAAIKNHFMKRRLDDAADKIKKWKDEEVYPYASFPAGPIEEAERQVFDILALNISDQIPEFERLDHKIKKFQFRLLRQIVGSNPNDLHVILTEVLNLSKEKQFEFASLLKDVSLSSIISAAKTVSDRLKFIAGLEEIIFNPDIKKVLKERSQLHKILAENTWVFGDQFSLSVNDKSLNEVLKIHLESKKIKAQLDKPVTRIDGSTGIIDLMFTRSVGLSKPNEREHLIVELKAPKVSIGEKELSQIKSYAFACIKDERFRSLKTKWNFWLISNDIDGFTETELKADKTASGVLYTTDDVTIYIKTWSQVIQECKHRLEFVKSQLNLNVDSSDGLKYLQSSYADYTKDLKVKD